MSNRTSSPSVKTSGKTAILIGCIAVSLFFIGGGAALSLGYISGAVVAQGAVSVQGKPKTVQHLDGGIVVEIFKDEGDFVNKNEPLLKLDQTLLAANIAIYSKGSLGKAGSTSG